MPDTFKPVVGSGAQYQMQVKDRSMKFAYAVVGTENFEGSLGYWMEIRSEGAGLPGETVMKELMVLQAGKGEIKRMIMQAPGQPPVEMPIGMMLGMVPRTPLTPEKGKASLGEKLGTESVTVPAGTFVCEHYRKQDGEVTIDYWISSQVSPYGMVKLTSAEMNLVLEKVLTNETTHIKGEPQKPQFEIPHF
jgi:hypothetical protein